MVCDNHLVIMLSALLKSIENSHTSDELIVVYIVNDGISKRNVKKIDRTLQTGKIILVWKTMKDAIPSDFKFPLENSIFPLNAYVRLFLHHFLPKDLNKAIYLDVDTIVLNDISILWEIDIKEHVLAAVIDEIRVVSSPSHGIRNYKELGMHPETKYFNSGLLVIDLQRWNDMNLTERVFDVIHKNSDFVTYPDQYGLNVVFANNWFELDPRWNLFAYNSDKNPFLIHFISIKPLFKGYYFNPAYQDKFYSILKLTPWNDYKPKDDYIWKLKRIRNKISKYSWLTIMKKSVNYISREIYKKIPISRY